MFDRLFPYLFFGFLVLMLVLVAFFPSRLFPVRPRDHERRKPGLAHGGTLEERRKDDDVGGEA